MEKKRVCDQYHGSQVCLRTTEGQSSLWRPGKSNSLKYYNQVDVDSDYDDDDGGGDDLAMDRSTVSTVHLLSLNLL